MVKYYFRRAPGEKPVLVEKTDGKMFARLINQEAPKMPPVIPDGPGQVAEIIAEHEDIENEWHPDFLDSCMEITGLDPQPEIGWVLQNGQLIPPPPPVLTPQQQALHALAMGVGVESVAHPEINGTYSTAGLPWQNMRDEAQFISTFGEFSGGLSSMPWLTLDTPVTFSTTDVFMSVVKAIANWITTWNRFANGLITDQPTSPIVISASPSRKKP